MGLNAPTLDEARLDEQLSNVSVAFTQDATDYVAGTVAPVIPVQQPAGFYQVIPKGEFFRNRVEPRPMGGRPPNVGHRLTRQPYAVEEYGLESSLDDRSRSNATPPYDPEESKVKQLTEEHMINKDSKWATEYFVTGQWTGNTEQTGVTGAPGANQFQFFNEAGSDPIGVIQTQNRVLKKGTGKWGNVLVLGSKVFDDLIEHPDIISRYVNVEPGVIGKSQLAEVFFRRGGGRVVVADAIQNTANPGAADSMDFILDERAMLLAYVTPTPGIDVPTAMYTFAWTGLLGPNAFQTVGVWRGRDGRAHSDWFQVRMAYSFQIVSADLGIFFNTAVDA